MGKNQQKSIYIKTKTIFNVSFYFFSVNTSTVLGAILNILKTTQVTTTNIIHIGTRYLFQN